ncbi:MAG: methyltransferase domain-containing protein [Chloroflexota bacterium]
MNVSVDEMTGLLADAKKNIHSFDTVLTRFEKTNTKNYGRTMPRWVPDYEETLQLISDTLTIYIPENANLADLGAGTGRASKRLLADFPAVSINLVDYSANMLSECEQTLAEFNGRYKTTVANLFDSDFTVGQGEYHATVSTFAICHGRRKEQYLKLYQTIFKGLKPGGCFICFDHIAGATDQLTALNMMNWHNFLAPEFDHATRQEIVGSTYEEDTPLSFTTHANLLQQAGFTAVDLLWKKQIFGIYIGIL